MRDPILHLLERLDDHWARHRASPPFYSWIDALPPELVDEAREELMLADLEHCLRQTPVTPLQRDSRLMVDQYREHPWVADNPSMLQRLIVEECILRCQCDESLSTDLLAPLAAARLSIEPYACSALVGARLAQQRRMIVQYSPRNRSASKPVTRYDLPAQLQLGRATADEGAAPLLCQTDPPRLTIAPPSERSISRQQVLVQRVGWNSIAIENLSAATTVILPPIDQLLPAGRIIVRVPQEILIGSYALRFSLFQSVSGRPGGVGSW